MRLAELVRPLLLRLCRALEDMGMVFGQLHAATLSLPAYDGVRDPVLLENLGHFGPLLGVDLQHPSDNVPAVPREKSQ